MGIQAAQPDAERPELQIRVADHIDLAMRHVQELQRQIAHEKAHVTSVVQSARLSDEEIAEIYWRFESVPVTALGRVQDVIIIAQRYPYWSWQCRGCNAEVFCTSRHDKKMRESMARDEVRRDSPSPYGWLCQSCHARINATSKAQQEAEQTARRQREQELRTMPYKLYLKTDEWQERRKAALKRAGYSCQVCNRRRTLHVHHRTYERRGVELARDLIALCDECHALYHGKGLLATHDESR